MLISIISFKNQVSEVTQFLMSKYKFPINLESISIFFLLKNSAKLEEEAEGKEVLVQECKQAKRF